MQVDLYEILKIISEEKLFCRQMLKMIKNNKNNKRDFIEGYLKFFNRMERDNKAEIVILYNLQKKLITLYRKKP